MRYYCCAQCNESFTAPHGWSIAGTDLFLCHACAVTVTGACLSEIEIPKPKTCLVKGCTNTSEHGPLLPVGDKGEHICSACMHMLQDGKIGPTDSFLKNVCPCSKFDNVYTGYTGKTAFVLSQKGLEKS